MQLGQLRAIFQAIRAAADDVFLVGFRPRFASHRFGVPQDGARSYTVRHDATITINRLPDSRYRLRRSLLLEVEQDTSDFVVSDNGTGVFRRSGRRVPPGFGERVGILIAHRDELSPTLCFQLDRFEQILVAEF